MFGKVSSLERNILETIARHRRLREYEKEQSWNDANPLTMTEIKTILGKDVSVAIKNLIRKGYIVKKGSGLYDLKHTFNGKFRRLDNKRPSEAVLTNFGSVRNFVHPTKNRPFTVRECARIQGFPDNFVIKGSLHSQYRQMGNAVPPPLAKIIAEEVRFEISKKLTRKRIVPVDFIPYAVREIISELKTHTSLKSNILSRSSFGTRLLSVNGNIERVCQRLDLLPIGINNKQQCSILN